ncbi:Methyltransferase domain-containing protein [Lentzea albidocapillata subsp. violacea]|uniref:Methyltransferase domain-containing protein n=1 Tax=Lentzea albidocapillata subsp. violacea TaxID=128104 RepID=A0A1G9HDH1_9PSEU|nr:class I SAM-dependent methyltransferase [Lentzea albidocapillata]SDL10902.1 Methyltransferase domain-containing protein [Lentzea albidocapillata subsp. violacea]
MAESDDQYDALGAIYERAKHIPTGLAERATLLSAVGDLLGRSVLDVACGTGFYARLFHDLGATKVVGVDSAGEMIGYARHVEEREPRGITYEQHDATDLPVLGEFDVVTAVWLLGYADDESAMDAMIANLTANLAPDGRLVVLVPNPDADWDLLAQYGRYGYEVTRTGPMNVKQPVSVHVLGDPPFDFDSFYWERGVFDGALTRAGLEVTREPAVTPVDDRGEEFWGPLRQSPSFAAFSAVRGVR